MDPITVAAASVLVHAMSTDAWQQAQAAMVELWRRVAPDQGEAIHAELTQTRVDVLASRESGDDAAEADLTAEWRLRIERLLSREPALADELRAFADGVGALLPDAQARPDVTVEARESGRGRIYQAGRDMHITVGVREGGREGNTPPGPPLGDDDDEW